METNSYILHSIRAFMVSEGVFYFKIYFKYSAIINAFNITVRFFLGNVYEITNCCILETDYVFMAVSIPQLCFCFHK